MNIIEAFHFIFDADASKLEEGLNDSEKANEKLKKGVVDTDAAAGKLGDSFLTLAKSFTGLIGGLFALGSLKAMAIASAENTNELNKQAKALNVNAGALYDWQNAAIASGGSAEAFNSTLANLSKRTRDPERALLRLADRFKGLSNIRAVKLGEQLGIDAGTAEMLRKGRDGVQGLLEKQRELGTVTAEQVAAADAYANSLRETNRVYDDVKRRVATIILPLLTKFLDVTRTIVMFLRDNQAFTIAFFATVAAIIAAVYLPAILSAVAATYALLAPYILIGAAIAAVAALIGLLVDDIMAFLDGNDSMIGEISKKWPIVGEVVKQIAEVFKYLWDVVKNIGQLLMGVFDDPAKAWDTFVSNMSASLDKFSAKFPILGMVVRAIGRAFTEAAGVAISSLKAVLSFVGVVIDVFGAGIKKLMELMPDWLKRKLGITMDVNVNAPDEEPKPLTDAGKQQVEAMVLAAQQNVAAMSGSTLNNQTSNAISNSRNVSKKTNVTVGKVEVVTTATDAEGMANGVASALQSQLSSAYDETNDGFSA